MGTRLFKAGAIVLLLLGLAHSLSLFQKPVPANDTERQLLDLMVNYKFNLMGSARSMDDLMCGFSVAFMLSACGLGTLDLVLSRERAELLKRVAAINAIWLAVMTCVSLRYFFAAPTSFLGADLLLLCAGLAEVAGRRKELRYPRGTGSLGLLLKITHSEIWDATTRTACVFHSLQPRTSVSHSFSTTIRIRYSQPSVFLEHNS